MKQEEMKKGRDGELGNFGRANIKSPAGAISDFHLGSTCQNFSDVFIF